MAKPHRALFDLAAGRDVSPIDDPDELLRSATAHGMVGLLWSRVAEGAVVLPRDQALQLASVDVARRERRAALVSALQHAVALLRDRGLGVATFKGVGFEQRWYDRIGERPCLDVDLLLAPDDVHRFGEAVSTLDPAYGRLRGLDRRIASGAQQAATIWLEGVTIDLHVEVPKLLVPSRGRELVWRRRTAVRLDDANVPALDAEAELFALFTGLLKDRFGRLITYVDLAHLAERSNLDWEVVHELAAADGVDRLLQPALDKVFATLDRRPPTVGSRRRLWSVTWSILSRPGATLTAPHPRPRRLLLVPLAVPGRRSEALRMLVRRAVPSRADARDLYRTGSTNPLVRLLRPRR